MSLSIPQDLDSQAGYGMLAFDHFVAKHWISAPGREDDGRQWERLAQAYLALTPMQRFVYLQKTFDARDAGFDDSVPANILPILRTQQTAQERNISLKTGRHYPIWIRTCYDPELESTYEEFECNADVHDNISVKHDMVLNDYRLYAATGTEVWRVLARRVPGLFDSRDLEEYLDDYLYKPLDNDDTFSKEHKSACRDATTIVYVINRYALRNGKVKMFWMTKVRPRHIPSVRGRLLDGESC